MNSYTITGKCITEGAHAIVSQKWRRAMVIGIFAASSLVAASVVWASAGNDAYLKFGSWDLSILFRHIIKAMVSLIVGVATFGILYRVATDITKGYAKRMGELWVAKTGGTMTVQIEGKTIKCDTEKDDPLFQCNDITDIIISRKYIVYVVCDQRKRMIAFLPLPLCARAFIDAVNQHLRPEVLAKMGDRLVAEQ